MLSVRIELTSQPSEGHILSVKLRERISRDNWDTYIILLDYMIPVPENVKIFDLGLLLSSLFGIVIIIAGLLSFFNFLMGGIQWIVSGGEEKALKRAQGRIIHSILGLIFVASSWAIMLLLQDFLGITILTPSSIPLPQ